MLIDSHCHLDCLDLDPYDGKINAVIEQARAQGVEHILCVNIDLERHSQVRKLAEQYDCVSASVGVHPLYQESREPGCEELIALGADPTIVAIGETGLDYYYCKGELDWQRARFETHLQAACELRKPVIIHTRDAKQDTLALLEKYAGPNLSGVLHCFTEDADMAQQAIAMGFYISFSGIVTFRNAETLREVVKTIPLERLLVETDAPYLAPVPYRGKSNLPVYVKEVAQCVADLKGLSLESLAEATTNNFYQLFKLAGKQ